MPPHLSGNSDCHSPSPWRIAPGLCLGNSRTAFAALAVVVVLFLVCCRFVVGWFVIDVLLIYRWFFDGLCCFVALFEVYCFSVSDLLLDSCLFVDSLLLIGCWCIVDMLLLLLFLLFFGCYSGILRICLRLVSCWFTILRVGSGFMKSWS